MCLRIWVSVCIDLRDGPLGVGGVAALLPRRLLQRTAALPVLVLLLLQPHLHVHNAHGMYML